MEDEKYKFCANNIFMNLKKNAKRPNKDLIKLKQKSSEISKNIFFLQHQRLPKRKIQIKRQVIKKELSDLDTLPNYLNIDNNKNANDKILLTESNKNNINNAKNQQLCGQFGTNNKKIFWKKDNKNQIFLTNFNAKKSNNSPETKTLETRLPKCNLPIIPKSNVEIMKREISNMSSKEASNKKSSRYSKMPKLTFNYKENISKSIENFETKNSELQDEIKNNKNLDDLCNKIFYEKVSNNKKRFFKKSDTDIDIFNDLNELCKNDFQNNVKFANSTEDLINDLIYSIDNKNYIPEPIDSNETIVDNEDFFKYKSKLLKNSLLQIDQRTNKEKGKDKKIENIFYKSKKRLYNIDSHSLKNYK